MILAGILSRSQGYPVDDPALMLGIISHKVPRTCAREDVNPRGTLTIQWAATPTINGQPLFDDDDVAVRWELEVDG